MKNESNIYLLAQSGSWESLGSISAISQYGEKKTFGLFVRVIGGKEFYQVRVYFSGTYNSYSVARGKFLFKGNEYNAKFSYFNTTYYFNI